MSNACPPTSNQRRFRRLAHANVNMMSSAGLGSFAYVGRRTSGADPAAPSQLYLALEVGEACQLRCRHCIYHREKALQARPNKLVFDSARKALGEGLDPLWVSLAGKEPTLFPKDLLALARLVRRAERITILMTNGLRLSGELLAELAPLVDYFDISVDGTEQAHDWMRGQGTFRRTWANVEGVVSGYESAVGLIATAVHATLPDGRPQIADLVSLAGQLRHSVGASRDDQASRLSLTISLYYGVPRDPLLLDADDLVRLVAGLAEADFDTRVIFTAHYAHLWPEVSRRLGCQDGRLEYDLPTGFPILRLGRLKLILFNLTGNLQLTLRVSNDGYLFLGCNQLALGSEAAAHRVGDLAIDDFGKVASDVMAWRHPIMRRLEMVPEGCLSCELWDSCRGGDRLSGLYHRNEPADPYCPLLVSQEVN